MNTAQEHLITEEAEDMTVKDLEANLKQTTVSKLMYYVEARNQLIM